jgi:hypothetical protein
LQNPNSARKSSQSSLSSISSKTTPILATNSASDLARRAAR